MRIPIVKGRAFSGADEQDAPFVAVISEALARRYFPNEDPLGRRVKVGAAESAPWHTIVGVAGDVSRFMFDRETQPILYLPNQQIPDRGAYFVVRVSGEPMALGAQPRDVLRLVIGQAIKLAALGLAIGLPVALALGQVMAGALFGVVALDPMTFVAFTLLLTAVATLAGYLPARRAMRVDPLVALHH